MNAIAQLQDATINATEEQAKFVFVDDAELIHVGGGSATGYF